MGSGSKSQTIGFKYYLSLLIGICRGPIDEIVQIKIGDLRAWPVPEGKDSETDALKAMVAALIVDDPTFSVNSSGIVCVAEGPNGAGVLQMAGGAYRTVEASYRNTLTVGGPYRIEAQELFGGNKREGGVEGSLTYMPGQGGQIVAPWIKALIGGRVSDFRGVATVFFDGLICSMNPYPKKWMFRIRRTMNGWDGPVWEPELCTIWLRGDTIKAMNPAHIIYECMTNTDWGRGYPREWLDQDEMKAVAQKLFNERFGLCYYWSRTSDLGEFISQIINTIGGSLYVDRSTGNISLGLLRGDFNASDLPLFTYQTGLLSIEDDDTATQDEIYNEVVVDWVDPIKNKERQTRVHNLASHQSMGALNTQKTSYSGIPNHTLAARVAQRDLKANASLLKRFTVVLDRRAWRIKPGDVFRISAPDREVYDVVLRAGKISNAGGTDGRITVTAVIDAFGLPESTFVSTPTNEWVQPSRTPVAVRHFLIREATWREVFLSTGPGDLATVTEDQGALAVLAAKPSDLSQAYNLVTRPEGEPGRIRGSGTFLPFFRIAEYFAVADTVITYKDGLDLGLIDFDDGDVSVQIGDEICKLTAVNVGASTITVQRGCVDTIPQGHPVDTKCFVIIDEVGTDDRDYARGDVAHVKMLPYTSVETFDQANATEHSLNITGRQGKPWAPGNLRLNGSPFRLNMAATGDMVFSWAHRNRLIIQDQLIPQTSGNTGGLEGGLTYVIRIYSAAGLLRTVTGLTAMTWTYTTAMATQDGASGQLRFQLEAVRGGTRSHSMYEIVIN